MHVMRKLPVVPICRSSDFRNLLLTFDPNHPHICAVPHLKEGRFAIVTSVGAGCDGRESIV
jgi:hypothetical protein